MRQKGRCKLYRHYCMCDLLILPLPFTAHRSYCRSVGVRRRQTVVSLSALKPVFSEIAPD